MAAAKRATTTVSTKGRVILPKAIREALRWKAGTRLAVESRGDAVLLKPVPVFAQTRPEDVFGSLSFDGPPKSVEEMGQGFTEEPDAAE